MNEKSIFDLKTMLNLKYLEKLLPNMTDLLSRDKKSEYSFAELKDLKRDHWKSWKEENKILDNKPEELENYIEVAAGPDVVFVPKELAEKAIILGFLP